MLRDQRNLIQNLLDTSILAPRKNAATVLTPTEVETKQKPAEDENRKKLLSVLEKVEGAGVRCAGYLLFLSSSRSVFRSY